MGEPAGRRRLVDRRAAADAGVGAVVQPLDAGDDGELAGALLVAESWPWSFLTLDSKVRLVLRSCSFSLLRRAISTGLTFLLKWSQVKRTAARVSRKKAPATIADLQAGDLPFAQLGVRVGDQDDRVVPFRHESSYKEPGDQPGHRHEPYLPGGCCGAYCRPWSPDVKRSVKYGEPACRGSALNCTGRVRRRDDPPHRL